LRLLPARRRAAGPEAAGHPGLRQLFAAAESGAGDSTVDLAGLIAGKGELEARGVVAKLVAQEVARILRLTAEDIDVGRRSTISAWTR